MWEWKYALLSPVAGGLDVLPSRWNQSFQAAERKREREREGRIKVQSEKSIVFSSRPCLLGGDCWASTRRWTKIKRPRRAVKKKNNNNNKSTITLNRSSLFIPEVHGTCSLLWNNKKNIVPSTIKCCSSHSADAYFLHSLLSWGLIWNWIWTRFCNMRLGQWLNSDLGYWFLSRRTSQR